MNRLMIPVGYLYFYIGNIISKPMNYFDWGWLYPLYNWFMLRSVDIQIETGKGPWTMHEPSKHNNKV